MRIFTYFCFVVILITLFLLGIDTEVARRDYVKVKENGGQVTGCIFDGVCVRYNKMLEHERKHKN